MNKFTKAAAIIKRVLRSPGVIRQLFDEEEYYKKRVIENHKLTSGLPQVDILDLLPGFNETVEPYSFLDGTSLPIDMALLKGCARLYPHCRYFEIGTWRGESVANVASVATHAVTMNLPDETMVAMGLPKSYVDLHRFFSKERQNITHLQHNSQTFDFKSYHEKPDLIFVDGDHHYESVKSDTTHAFEILQTNGIIIWHDYAFSPESIRWAVLAGMLDGCPAALRKNLYQVSNTMCAIYTNRPLKTSVLKPFQQPDKFFSVNITAHKL